MSDPAGLRPHYNLTVVGGGVHGAALALEATRAGLKVLLVEKSDFCSGTSANSLKIIHGGLRYLQSLNIRRSRESAREQSELLSLAPHLVRRLPCLMSTEPSFARGKLAMSLALWFYDNVVCFGLPNRMRGRVLSKKESSGLLEMGERDTGAALWYDAQVVDSERLVLTYLKTAESAGAVIRNYVSAMEPHYGDTVQVELKDEFNSETSVITTDVLIDTASFLDPHPHWARAANLVFTRDMGRYAIGRKPGGDGIDTARLFFATPLLDSTIVGTWYFEDKQDLPDRLTESELAECLGDVRNMFHGLGVKEDDLSRVHVGRLPISKAGEPMSLLDKPLVKRVKGRSNVVSVTGVKYTTARPAARRALQVAGFRAPRASRNEAWYGAWDAGATYIAIKRRLREAGKLEELDESTIQRLLRQYGSNADDIVALVVSQSDGTEAIPGFEGLKAELDYCIRHEHCKTVADFLLRRSGIGALSPPPRDTVSFCVSVMGKYFSWSESRSDAEVENLWHAFNLPYPSAPVPDFHR